MATVQKKYNKALPLTPEEDHSNVKKKISFKFTKRTSKTDDEERDSIINTAKEKALIGRNNMAISIH